MTESFTYRRFSTGANFLQMRFCIDLWNYIWSFPAQRRNIKSENNNVRWPGDCRHVKYRCGDRWVLLKYMYDSIYILYFRIVFVKSQCLPKLWCKVFVLEIRYSSNHPRINNYLVLKFSKFTITIYFIF